MPSQHWNLPVRRIKHVKSALWVIVLALWSLSPVYGAVTNLLDSKLEDLLKQAALEQKPVLIAFIGRGWSVASDRFEQRVLKDEAFVEFSRNHLLLGEIHGRAHPKLPKKIQARLQALVIHFDVKAYPTFILLAPDGTEVLRHGYRDITGEQYADLLRAVLSPAMPDD